MLNVHSRCRRISCESRQGLNTWTLIEFNRGLYVTWKTRLVTVLVGVVELGVVPLPPVPPPLLDDVLGEQQLKPLNGRLPMMLKVTVNDSLFGLRNFKARAPDTSAAESTLSAPTRLL